MGCAQSTSASPQQLPRPILMLANAQSGPDSAINNFCNMARASSEPQTASPKATAPASGPGSAINNFCNLAGAASAVSQQKVQQATSVHSQLHVLGVPRESHQARTPSRSSEAYVSEASSRCSTSTPSSSSRNVLANVFPDKMSLDLKATSFRASDFVFDTAGDGQRLAEWSMKTGALGFAAHRFLAPQLEESEKQTIRGHISEPHQINLSDSELCDLGIVRNACHFAFSYPIVTAQELTASVKDARVADIAFLLFGGYMYFDADMVLKDVRAVIPSDDGCLRFGPPQKWLPEWTVAVRADRWRPVTLPALRALGVRYFSWLRPGESVDSVALCRNGGFAYIFHEPCETSTLQAQLDVFFQLEDAEVDHSKCCPQCGGTMEWSDYNEGAYAGGWACDNAATCGQTCTSQGPSRWCCAHCEVDVCGDCSLGLVVAVQARRLLHT